MFGLSFKQLFFKTNFLFNFDLTIFFCLERHLASLNFVTCDKQSLSDGDIDFVQDNILFNILKKGLVFESAIVFLATEISAFKTFFSSIVYLLIFVGLVPWACSFSLLENLAVFSCNSAGN